MASTTGFFVLLVILGYGAPVTVTVTQGHNVTLPCNYTLSRNLPPNSPIIWKSPKGNALSGSSFSLQLLNVSTEQEGIYQCHITDVRFQQDVELIVTAKRTDEVVHIPPKCDLSCVNGTYMCRSVEGAVLGCLRK